MSNEKIVNPGTRSLETLRFDLPVPYADAYARQIERRNAIESGDAGNALFLLQHPPTYTIGRNADRKHLLVSEEALDRMGIETCEVDRGGDITYHGPGQLVAYPLLDLSQWRRSINWYLRTLEDVVIALLDEYGLTGERLEGYTGVWVRGGKVAAIGVGFHNWVTYHGTSLNIDPDMTHYQHIIPCGIPDKPVTSLAQLLETVPTYPEISDAFERHFRSVFDVQETSSSLNIPS